MRLWPALATSLFCACSTNGPPVKKVEHSAAKPRGSEPTPPDASPRDSGVAGSNSTLSDAGGTGGAASTSHGKRFVLLGGTVFGVGRQNLLVENGHIAAVGVTRSAAEDVVEVSGRYIAPGFIDSHVHLAYYEVADDLLSSGIVAVLDLAAPLATLKDNHAPLRVLNTGPMITAKLGYPTTSWGSGGYGLEVSSSAEAVSAVDQLLAAGVQAIKVPLTAPPLSTTPPSKRSSAKRMLTDSRCTRTRSPMRTPRALPPTASTSSRTPRPKRSPPRRCKPGRRAP